MHPIYLSKVCKAEIVIVSVIDVVKNMEKTAKNQTLVDRVRFCKIGGVDEVSYIIREGTPVDEIVSVSQERAYI